MIDITNVLEPNENVLLEFKRYTIEEKPNLEQHKKEMRKRVLGVIIGSALMALMFTLMFAYMLDLVFAYTFVDLLDLFLVLIYYLGNFVLWFIFFDHMFIRAEINDYKKRAEVRAFSKEFGLPKDFLINGYLTERETPNIKKKFM